MIIGPPPKFHGTWDILRLREILIPPDAEHRAILLRPPVDEPQPIPSARCLVHAASRLLPPGNRTATARSSPPSCAHWPTPAPDREPSSPTPFARSPRSGRCAVPCPQLRPKPPAPAASANPAVPATIASRSRGFVTSSGNPSIGGSHVGRTPAGGHLPPRSRSARRSACEFCTRFRRVLGCCGSCPATVRHPAGCSCRTRRNCGGSHRGGRSSRQRVMP